MPLCSEASRVWSSVGLGGGLNLRNKAQFHETLSVLTSLPSSLARWPELTNHSLPPSTKAYGISKMLQAYSVPGLVLDPRTAETAVGPVLGLSVAREDTLLPVSNQRWVLPWWQQEYVEASWRKGSVYTSFSENWPFPKGPGEGMECPLATGDRIQAKYGPMIS